MDFSVRRPMIARPSLCMALVLLHGSTLYAQQSPPTGASSTTAAMPDKARELFLDGQKAMAKGRWGEAHAAFLAAWSLKKQYQIAGNLGSMEVELKRYREAAEHLSYYLREAPKTKEKERLKALSLLAEVRKHIASVTIRVSVPGAMVLVDGEAIGKAPLAGEVFVEPGAHVIEAKLEGYEAAKQGVSAGAGTAQDVEIRLLPIASTSSSSGSVSRTPNATQPPQKAPEVTHPESPEWRRPLIIGGLVGAGAIAVAGIGFAIASNMKASDAEALLGTLKSERGSAACTGAGVPETCMELQDAIKAKDGLANAAAWSLIGAGLLGAGTAVIALTAPATERRSRVSITPVFERRGGGLVLHGGW